MGQPGALPQPPQQDGQERKQQLPQQPPQQQVVPPVPLQPILLVPMSMN